MAFVTGGKHFGQYTYEHWFDHEHEEKDEIVNELENKELEAVEENKNNDVKQKTST
jgi:hypothetical protein